MHGENFSIDDGRETELRHAANIRRPGRAIFGDDRGANVDELAIGNCLEIFRFDVELGDLLFWQ